MLFRKSTKCANWRCWKPVGGYAFCAKLKGRWYWVNEETGAKINLLRSYLPKVREMFYMSDEVARKAYNRLRGRMPVIHTLEEFDLLAGVELNKMYQERVWKEKEVREDGNSANKGGSIRDNPGKSHPQKIERGCP